MIDETIPCKVCREPTDKLGTQLCDPCWELTRSVHYGLIRGIIKKLHLREGHLPEGVIFSSDLAEEVFGHDR